MGASRSAWFRRGFAALAAAACVIAAGFWGAAFARAAGDATLPCSASILAGTETFASTLGSAPGVSNVEVLTYDCDSGAPPSISFDVRDGDAFWRYLAARPECRIDRSGVSAPEPAATCEVGSTTFTVDDGSAHVED